MNFLPAFIHVSVSASGAYPCFLVEQRTVSSSSLHSQCLGALINGCGYDPGFQIRSCEVLRCLGRLYSHYSGEVRPEPDEMKDM